MPGLVVILGEPGKSDLAASLDQMLAPLTYSSYQTSRVILSDMGVAVGYTGPRRLAFPPAGQDVTGQVLVVLEGMPSDIPRRTEELGLPAGTSPATAIAHLVVHHGFGALESLDGHWAAAVIDRRIRQVAVACDPFGIRALYQTRVDDGTWLIATQTAGLLAHPAVRRELNPAGLVDFLAFGHPIGTKTIFARINLLPAATLLRWAEGQLSARRYWSPQFRPEHNFTEDDLEDLRLRFNHNVASVLAGGQPCTVALSGGGDSRVVLSAMLALGTRPDTVTHSIPGATDAQLSALVALRANTRHHFYPVRGKELVGQVIPGIQLLAGRVAGIDVHPLCFLDDIAGYTRTILTGLAGNLYRAHNFIVERPGRFSSLSALADYIIDNYNQLISVKELPELLTPDWYPAAQHPLHDSVLTALANSAEHTSDISCLSAHFYLEERIRKYLTKGDAIVRREIETWHPFLDRWLFIRSWKLPFSARFQNVLHSYIITRNAPELADIPFSYCYYDPSEGLPLRRYPQGRLRRLITRLSQSWERARHRLGIVARGIPNYAYGDWLRGPLRLLVMDILLDNKTARRPYLRHETVRRWLDEHMAGHNHTGKLSALLSLELTVRLLIERESIV